jgi:hypothetical protein
MGEQLSSVGATRLAVDGSEDVAKMKVTDTYKALALA